jgi:hypothetical protein
LATLCAGGEDSDAGAERATPRVIELDRLPVGTDVVLELDDGYAVGVEPDSREVSESVWSKVVRLYSRIRQHEGDDTP